ncbi:uncharacterized protein BT62DRAFT_919170 [Guyanagaster necrorhizus]|uniref:Uncharacterized protein n=1 Tax=Guyanagaster necrorhizus TaxID=856835 RepID=A0A9P8ATA1_9AGAR|nr:uncharacterized protein BT62DRAFT_919170 [Guyanagaster necrorhizus MCA 3950]KAG7447228.1 hypothetical protein BT62DRAFT_919170 [Guyanagaster necrorhizus MCA 3950]
MPFNVFKRGPHPQPPPPRKTTLDVADILQGFDFISRWLHEYRPGKEFRIVVSGAGRACPNSVHWPVNWINAEMVAYVLNNEGCEHLFQNSVAKGIMLYSSGNFKVYAADWRFQLVGKIRRAYDAYLDHEPSPKDLYDAVDILHILNVKDGRNQRSSDMKKWYYYGYRMGSKEVDICPNVAQQEWNLREAARIGSPGRTLLPWWIGIVLVLAHEKRIITGNPPADSKGNFIIEGLHECFSHGRQDGVSGGVRILWIWNVDEAPGWLVVEPILGFHHHLVLVEIDSAFIEAIKRT